MKTLPPRGDWKATIGSLTSALFLLPSSLLQAQNRAPAVRIESFGAEAVRLSWPGSAANFLLEEAPALGATAVWQPVSQNPSSQGGQWVVDIAPSETTRFYRLRAEQASFQILRHTPLDGATDVGVTFRPQVFFSQPVDASTLTSDNFFGTAAGIRVNAKIVPANDGSFAWLFFQQPLSGGARVRVTVDGSTIRSSDGAALLDADNDGQPGGAMEFEFTTVSTTALAETSLSGIVVDPGPDLIPRTADDVDPGPDGIVNTLDDGLLLPIAGVKVFLLGREDQVVTTGPNGRFHFDAVPAGDVKVVINGLTATAPPAGMYFPEMVMDAQMIPGTENYTMLGMPPVYLPRLSRQILQNLDVTKTNLITTQPEGAPGLSAAQRQFLTIEVPPNALVAADGTKLASGQIGISTVPSELVRDMLPPGVLQHTFDVTVQAPGIATFATPAPMTFPNVFNAAPGTQLNFLSFDHTTGRLVIEGTATVSADGQSVRTDPGVGVTHPGWHGLTPPGGPNDPPCDPTAVHDIDVPPIPLSDGIKSYFFSDSPTSQRQFVLSFANAAARLSSDPKESLCGGQNVRATPLVVEVVVDGAAEGFLDGLKSQTIMLLPGQKQDLAVRLKAPAEKLQTIESDRFYGARVKIVAYQFGKTERLLDKEIYIYRFLDATDATHSNAQLTLADTAQGLTRIRPFDYILGGLAKPTLIVSPPDQFSVIDLPADAFTFHPKVAFGVLTGQLDVVTPAGVLLSHVLSLAGEAKRQKWYVDKVGFAAELADLYINHPDLLVDSQKVLLDTEAKRADLVAQSIQGAELLLTGYPNGLYRVETPDTDAIRIDSFLTPPSKTFYELGVSDHVDFKSPEVEQLIKLRGSLSKAEQNYRLSVALNQEASGSVQIYLRHYVGASPRFSSADEFANTLGKTIAHEIGHCVGLPHALGTDDKGNSKFLGPDKATAERDIMAQGEDYAGARRFELSEGALLVAIGESWSTPEAQKGVDYFGMFLAQGGGFDAFETGRDGNALAPVSLGGAVAWVFSEPEGVFVSGSFDFGNALTDGANTVPIVHSFTLRNLGDEPLVVNHLELTGSDAFRAAGLADGVTVAPMTELPFSITFSPKATGPAQARFALSGNALAGPYELDLLGSGKSSGAELRALVPNNNVGGAFAGAGAVNLSNFVTLTNAGSTVLAITEIKTFPASAQAQFAPVGLPAGFGMSQPLQLQPGQTFSFDLSFAPNVAGLLRGQLQIVSNDPTTPVLRIQLVGTGLNENGRLLDALDYGNDYVAMESPDFPEGPVLRAKTDNKGNFSFFLPPDERFHAVIFDPVSGLVAHLRGTTAISGQTTSLGIPVFLPSIAPDADGDGLPDDIEFAIGTDPRKTDTDGDGIDDFAAVTQGADPLGGQAAVTGIIAQVPLGDDALDLVVLPNSKGDRLLAYVAASTAGLVIEDVTRPSLPTLIGRLAIAVRAGLPERIRNVSVDPLWRVAAVVADSAAGSFIHLVDVSDPGALKLIKTYMVSEPSSVVAYNGYAYFHADFGKLYALNTRSGLIEQTMQTGVNFIRFITREGAFLYMLDSNSALTVVEIHGSEMRLRGSFAAPAGGGAPVVANGIAYIPLISSFDPVTQQTIVGGYATVDVSDPDHPVLISKSSVPAGIAEPGTALAVSGSGFGILIGNAPGTGSVADLLNVSDPKNTYSFLTRFPLPDAPQAVTIASGTAFIANGPAGLLTLSFQSLDVAGKAPTPIISGLFAETDPANATSAIIEGSRFNLQATVADDAQVRNVELLVNGRVVQNSVTFPLELEAFAPNIAGTNDTFVVQVRATDTGGNVGVSAPATIRLLRDTIAPVLLQIDPAEAEEKFRGLDSLHLVFSEPLASASLTATNFEIVLEGGTVYRPKAFVTQNFDKEVELKLAPLEPGNYQFIIHAAAITDRAGNPLGRADINRNFRVLRYSIRWNRSDTADWFAATNWIPSRVPTSNDWVYIGPSATNNYVYISPSPSSLALADPGLNPVHVRGLESASDLLLYYSTLRVDEPFVANGSLYLLGSKLADTVFVAGTNSVLGYNGGHPTSPFVTKEGYFSVLERVKIQGDARIESEYHIIDSLTLQGNVSGRLNRSSSFNGLLHATRDTILQGPGTFHDLPFDISSGELNDPGRKGPLVTIAADVTFRGALDIRMEGVSSRLINRGQLLADDPLPFASGRYYSQIVMYGNGATAPDEYIINEGTIEASNGYRLNIAGPYNTGLTNHGVLKAADRSLLWLSVPVASSKIVCEAGGVVWLPGQGAPWVTESNQVAELSGPGLWFAIQTEFRGGAIHLTDGAVLEGTALFNNVTFEGELHNYDWNTRMKDLPDYLTSYGAQVLVTTNLTLNGLIVFHRPSAVEFGGSVFFLGSQSRLDGHGRIEFEQTNNFNQIKVAGYADSSGFLTIGPDITIHGGNLTIGDIRGDYSQLPFIENRGMILAQPGDYLSFGTYGFTNSGVIHIGGTNLVNAGINFSQTATGRLEFEVSNSGAGPSNAKLNITGSATLDGGLVLSAVAPFQPKAGDSFELLDYPSFQGRFSSLSGLPPVAGLQYTGNYGPNAFSVELRPSAAGAINAGVLAVPGK